MMRSLSRTSSFLRRCELRRPRASVLVSMWLSVAPLIEPLERRNFSLSAVRLGESYKVGDMEAVL